MRLYRLAVDGETDFVEAETMAEAIAIWRVAALDLAERDKALPTWADSEPDEVQIVHDTVYTRAVLRKGERYEERQAR